MLKYTTIWSQIYIFSSRNHISHNWTWTESSNPKIYIHNCKFTINIHISSNDQYFINVEDSEYVFLTTKMESPWTVLNQSPAAFGSFSFINGSLLFISRHIILWLNVLHVYVYQISVQCIRNVWKSWICPLNNFIYKECQLKIDFKVQNLICLSKLKITNIRVENPTLEKAK